MSRRERAETALSASAGQSIGPRRQLISLCSCRKDAVTSSVSAFADKNMHR
jgi:hypothetical protein